SDSQIMQVTGSSECSVQQSQLQETDDTKYPSWESLPWPALDRIFSFLRTDEECFDLSNLANLSSHFRAQVKKFIGTPSNQPGVDFVEFTKTDDGLEIWMELFPSNIPFYDLSKVDWGRFKRSIRCGRPCLEATLKDSEDDTVEQV
ncbi:hypothetical protein PMAYCL1PPCAC_28048, partial [Pristionchus mayeri]